MRLIPILKNFIVIYFYSKLIFLKQNKVGLYNELTILEFLEAIMNFGAMVIKEEPYLIYSPIPGK